MTDQYLTTALNDLAKIYGPEQVIELAHALWPQKAPPEKARDVGRFSLGSRSATMLRVLCEQPGPRTAHELAVIANGDGNLIHLEGLRRRVSDLVTAGYAWRDTGRVVASYDGRVALELAQRTGWTSRGES